MRAIDLQDAPKGIGAVGGSGYVTPIHGEVILCYGGGGSNHSATNENDAIQSCGGASHLIFPEGQTITVSASPGGSHA